MSEPTDMDIRVNALAQEFQNIINTLSGRCASLSADNASLQAKLNAANARLLELEKQNENPDTPAVPGS